MLPCPGPEAAVFWVQARQRVGEGRVPCPAAIPSTAPVVAFGERVRMEIADRRFVTWVGAC